MRRASVKVLPSLSSAKKNNPQSTQRSSNSKGVKQIQQKLSVHENQITRNQSTILALTSDFKLLKEQLQREQAINNDNEQVYQATMQQNSGLLKRTKELKIIIGSLQVALKQREKQLLRQRQTCKKQHLVDNQSRIIQLKKIIDRKSRQNQSLNKTVEQLRKQIEVLKKPADNSKVKADLVKFQGSIQSLEGQLQMKEKRLKQLERQINCLKEGERRYINIVKEHSKCEYQLNQVKKTNQVLLQTRKQQQGKISQLEADRKKWEDKLSRLQQETQKGSNKTVFELSETQQKLERERKSNESNVKSMEGLRRQIQKLKNVECKLSNFSKSKQNLKTSSGKLKESIICDYCRKIFNQPVTNIPCGHSYCLQCKKGYEKQCKKCVSGSSSHVKREAVYRNELMDEVLQAYHVLTQILRIFDV